MSLQEEVRFALLWGADGTDDIVKVIYPDGLFGEGGTELGDSTADSCFPAGHAADWGKDFDQFNGIHKDILSEK